MSTEVQPIDITESSELLHLAEEVRRSGVTRLLKRGEQDLALLTPVAPRQSASSRRQAQRGARHAPQHYRHW